MVISLLFNNKNCHIQKHMLCMSVNYFVIHNFLQHFFCFFFYNIVHKIAWPTLPFYHITLSDMFFNVAFSRSF